jgi:hypothetical protein
MLLLAQGLQRITNSGPAAEVICANFSSSSRLVAGHV